MAVQFRCQKCDRIVTVLAEAGAEATCPFCRDRTVVPSAPAVVGAGPEAPEGQAAAPPAEPPVEEGRKAKRGWLARVPHEYFVILAGIAPWAVSVAFHAAVALVLMVAAILVVKDTGTRKVIIPDAFLSQTPGGVMAPSRRDMAVTASKEPASPTDDPIARDVAVDTGGTAQQIDLIAAGGEASQGTFRLQSGGETAVTSTFYGTGGNANHIVYVVDHSGSMMDSFPFVRMELLRSVSKLTAAQDFHVILFSSGAPLENPPRRLVKAVYKEKANLAEFLDPIVPGGGTDPTDALTRAFAVLDKADRLGGKLIYLLTDGEFRDCDKVVNALRELNSNKDVVINTYMYAFRPEKGIDVLKQIAAENGGQYRYVAAEE
jgi:Mg-chelatase subunit ChlD